MVTKEEVWKIHDKLEELKNQKSLIGLSEMEDIELRNLEVNFYNKWSELKDA